jgi:hypothetical protein
MRELQLLPPRLLRFALLLALVSTLLSLSAVAADSLQFPDDDTGYPSAEAAFAAEFITSGLGERAYRENREYAAAIYQLPDGSWHCTPAMAGSRTGSAIPYHAVPTSAVQIVGAHTHGQPHIPEDPWQLYGVDFSQADLRNAVHNYRTTKGRIAAQLLLTSDLRILRLTLSGEADPAAAEEMETSLQAGRLRSGGIHGRSELLGQLRIPAGSRVVSGESRSSEAGRPPASTMAYLGPDRPGSN